MGEQHEERLYERGYLVWHTSEEEGGGPDVGASVGLGGGRMLYAGEISNDTLEKHGADPGEWGASWHLVVFGQDSTEIIAAVINAPRAVAFVEEIAAALSASPQTDYAGMGALSAFLGRKLDPQAEALAKRIYEGWSDQPGWVPWVEGGNSDKQEEARRIAAEQGDADACPICAVAFKPDDVCATDVELSTCHAACLEGSPVVNLQTGEPFDGPVSTYRYDSLPQPKGEA